MLGETQPAFSSHAKNILLSCPDAAKKNPFRRGSVHKDALFNAAASCAAQRPAMRCGAAPRRRPIRCYIGSVLSVFYFDSSSKRNVFFFPFPPLPLSSSDPLAALRNLGRSCATVQVQVQLVDNAGKGCAPQLRNPGEGHSKKG